MTLERWQKIEELFVEAIALPSADRVDFLDGKCEGDVELRTEIERLLYSHDKGRDFIERPAIEIVASDLANESAQARLGEVVGRYRILELIGAGGMGEVYLAEDTALGRKVALKVLLPAYASKDSDSLRRFHQEGRAASALNHPNTAHIYEIGEADGANFIAMEYVDGQPLDSRINGRPLDAAEIVDIGIQVADALDEAHGKGITHRDIKSANIIITARGVVKVLDFGLAKTATGIDQSAEEKDAQFETRPGVVLGTISYMSPEQALGRKVDTRTDLFSLGVVLYEMATGRLPFSGESVTETIDKIAHAQPDAMSRFNYDVSEELERIVKKALRKSRGERYQTARDLLVDLRNLKRELDFATQSHNVSSESSVGGSTVSATGTGTGATLPRTTQAGAGAHATSSAEYIVGQIKSHKLVASLAALGLIAVIVALPFLLKKYLGSEHSGISSTVKTMKTRRLITSATGGKAGNTSISPDGRFVAYKDDEVDRRQALWIRQVATGTTRQLVAPDEVLYRGTTFSRDGNFIYYVVQGTKYPSGALFQISVNGGPAKQVMSGISGPITQSPNGAQFSYGYENHLMTANMDGTGARPLAPISGTELMATPGPAWSPDGKVVAFGSRSSDGPYTSVFTVDVISGDVKQITKHEWSSVRRMLWFGDGNGLVVLASSPEQDFSQVWGISYPSGEVRRITNDVNGHGVVSLGLTADSTTLVTQQEDDISDIWITSTGDVSETRQLTSGEGRTDGRFGLAWLSNGSLVYSIRVEAGWNLGRIDIDGTPKDPITVNAYRDEYPAITPDGKTLIFQSTRGTGRYQLWRMDLNGSQPKQLTTGDAENMRARLSADGRWLVYTSVTARQERLWKVSIDGGEPVQLTDYQSRSPDVSPDGKSIACAFLDETIKPARWRVGIIPFSGGQPVRTIDLPASAYLSRTLNLGRVASYVRWVNGGRALTYVDRQNGNSNIWLQPIYGGPPTRLTNFPSGQIFSFEFSPDGKQIACARGAATSDVILITDFR